MSTATRTGLVLGKFMPLHRGHLELIRFAQAYCDRLIVLVGVSAGEPIPGPLRRQWVEQELAGQPGIEVHYMDEEMPQSAVASRMVSKAWAEYLAHRFPELAVIFTSEAYGAYVAEYMGIDYVDFDPPRQQVPISATLIREAPFNYWDFIPQAVRPYFVKKICLYGPESTGKSVLSEQLARHFHTAYVPEMARFVIGSSLDCTYEDMTAIAEAQAAAIQETLPAANKLLFCDSDLLTTKVYSEYLFGRTPAFAPWVEAANRYDLHLFLEADVPYVQDGTRLGAATRPVLRAAFLAALQAAGVPYAVVSGASWEHRFRQAVGLVEQHFGVSAAPLVSP